MQKVIRQIAAEIRVHEHQVKAAVDLLDGGATVPFVARYPKEATGGLDDVQLRELEYRLGYLRELEQRRAAVLKSVKEQGKLTPILRAAIEAAPTKQLSHKFIKDAHEVVKTGDIVTVRVMEMDVARKRIGLSMKLGEAPARRDGPRDNRYQGAGRGERAPQEQPLNTALAGAFAKLQRLRK